jgi:hypothetical protein
MGAAQQILTDTLAEYIAFDESRQEKYEYLAG